MTTRVLQRVLLAVGLLGVPALVAAQTTDTVTVRGHRIPVYLYGPRTGTPVVGACTSVSDSGTVFWISVVRR